MSVLEVTDENFEEEIVYSELPVVVDFWAPWCGPCKAFAPVFEKISKKFDGRIKFMKCNVEKNKAVAEMFGVKSVPTLLFFCDGKVVDRSVGSYPIDSLEKKLLWLEKQCE